MEIATGETFGENRQRYNARKIVADFFGVTEYEIRKAIKLAALIPPLADILENSPRKLPIACAELIADYGADSQRAFVEMCTIEGYTLNKAAMQKIVHICPPPSAECKPCMRLGGRHGQTRKCVALHHLRKSPLTAGNLHLIWTN